MQAVIIAGGKGTRLRPFTLRSPKPLIPLLDIPFLDWMILRCREAGLTDILINIGYLGEQIQARYQDGSVWGVRIRYIQESTPLDTAGALLLGRPYFSGEPLVVFNADILTDLNLVELMDWHRRSGAVGTLTLTRVLDITAYGLVETAEQGRIQAFREKPTAAEAATITTDTINAGTYVLDPSVFDLYTAGDPLSFERVVFPHLVSSGQVLSSYVFDGYWRDLGTPGSYYQGQLDILSGQMQTFPLADVQQRAPGVWIHQTAQVDGSAQLTAPCFVGAHSMVGPAAVLPSGTLVGQYCWVNRPLEPGVYASGTLAL